MEWPLERPHDGAGYVFGGGVFGVFEGDGFF